MRLYASKNAARRGYSARYAPDDRFPGIMPTNVILDVARDNQTGDAWSDTLEALYALHRLWNDYQSPGMGMSPIDARDAGDECQLYDDMTYELQRRSRRANAGMIDGITTDEISAMIQHATRVMQRYADILDSQGRSY